MIAMAATKRTRDELIQQDVEDLKRLAYAQQLFREMGGSSNFAISFSIISILTDAVLLFGYGLKFAGPVINSVGWPIVSLFTLCVAASMAELASAYPTAGGFYFWAFRLGGRGWAWTTAWMNMIGQVTITAGINIAAAIYLIGAATRIFDLPAELSTSSPSRGQRSSLSSSACRRTNSCCGACRSFACCSLSIGRAMPRVTFVDPLARMKSR
jgi:amino acid transporter